MQRMDQCLGRQCFMQRRPWLRGIGIVFLLKRRTTGRSTLQSLVHPSTFDSSRERPKYREALESGQLQVLRGSKVEWNDPEFVLYSEDVEHRATVLIESLGQEFDTSKIESPLIEQVVTRRLFQPHPAGGACVDFITLKAGDGIHVIGSLTKGVHFYTTSIDRNAAHASRIADSLIGLPVRRPIHIAFFVGIDIFSHLMLNKLVPQLLALGHIPFIFMPSDAINSKTVARPFALMEIAFFERTLLQEHTVPFLGSSVQTGAPCMTVEQLKVKYGFMVETVPNLNSLHFLQTVKVLTSTSGSPFAATNVLNHVLSITSLGLATCSISIPESSPNIEE